MQKALAGHHARGPKKREIWGAAAELEPDSTKEATYGNTEIALTSSDSREQYQEHNN